MLCRAMLVRLSLRLLVQLGNDDSLFSSRSTLSLRLIFPSLSFTLATFTPNDDSVGFRCRSLNWNKQDCHSDQPGRGNNT